VRRDDAEILWFDARRDGCCRFATSFLGNPKVPHGGTLSPPSTVGWAEFLFSLDLQRREDDVAHYEHFCDTTFQPNRILHPALVRWFFWVIDMVIHRAHSHTTGAGPDAVLSLNNKKENPISHSEPHVGP